MTGQEPWDVYSGFVCVFGTALKPERRPYSMAAVPGVLRPWRAIRCVARKEWEYDVVGGRVMEEEWEY